MFSITNLRYPPTTFETKLPPQKKKNISETVRFFTNPYLTAGVTLSPIIMEVENHPKWKETNIEVAPFSTEPWSSWQFIINP